MSGQEDMFLAERRSLLSGLLDAVKQCQIRFGGRTELATDSDSRVSCLCSRLEAVFNHGKKKNNKGLAAIRQVTEKVTGLSLKNSESDVFFWHFVKEFLNKHEYERFMLLKNIISDSGRGRAWLRSALNERSLEKYMHMMLADLSFMSHYYEDWAFLVDQERSSMLPMMSAGLGSILFAINIDDSNLNSSAKSSVIISSSPPSVSPTSPVPVSSGPMPVIAKDKSAGLKRKEKRKKKKTLDQIVSFDEDALTDMHESSPLTTSSSVPALPVLNADETPKVTRHSSDSSSGHLIVITDEANNPKNSCDNVFNLNVRNSYGDISQDGGLSDVSGEVSIASSASEDSSMGSSKLSTKKFNDGDSKNFNRSSSNTESGQPSETKKATLTPVTDTSVELIPVSDDDQRSQSEDSLSIPSFTEDTDHAAQALALTQRAVLSSSPGLGPNGILRNSLQCSLSNEKRMRSDTISSLKDSDLKQAIYNLLQKKEEAEDQNRSLRHLLDQEMEMSSSLRIQIEEMEKINQSKLGKENLRLEALSRENEVLKHQLKKYVGAVQMLKRDTLKTHEVLSSNNEGQLLLPGNQNAPYIDHEYEAMEYEKKLVQVAEMHGELMEFNEHLHRMVLQKDFLIRRLKEDLVDLRGPLPDNGHLSDDEVLSISSDNDTSSLSSSTRALINIWIPSAFMTGQSKDTHHVYQVFIRIKDLEWNIYRRYSHFYLLHQELRKTNQIVNTFNFPPKKAIGSRDSKLVEGRRQKLQHYLRCVVNYMVKNTSELANNPDKETLVKLMPFFGEFPSDSSKSKNKRKQTTFPGSSIQSYTGL